MATENETWDGLCLHEYLAMANSKAKLGSGSFMMKLFFDLEIESGEAKELGKKNAKFESSIRKKLGKLKSAYLNLRKVLLEATKESYKY